MSDPGRQLLIELSDEEFQIVTESELRKMVVDAVRFDGIEGWRVVGYCDELSVSPTK